MHGFGIVLPRVERQQERKGLRNRRHNFVPLLMLDIRITQGVPGVPLVTSIFVCFVVVVFSMWWLFQRAIQAHVAEVTIDIYKEQYV